MRNRSGLSNAQRSFRLRTPPPLVKQQPFSPDVAKRLPGVLTRTNAFVRPEVGDDEGIHLLHRRQHIVTLRGPEIRG